MSLRDERTGLRHKPGLKSTRQHYAPLSLMSHDLFYDMQIERKLYVEKIIGKSCGTFITFTLVNKILVFWYGGR